MEGHQLVQVHKQCNQTPQMYLDAYGIVPVWSLAPMALDHFFLLQYTHPANSTRKRTY